MFLYLIILCYFFRMEVTFNTKLWKFVPGGVWRQRWAESCAESGTWTCIWRCGSSPEHPPAPVNSYGRETPPTPRTEAPDRPDKRTWHPGPAAKSRNEWTRVNRWTSLPLLSRLFLKFRMKTSELRARRAPSGKALPSSRTLPPLATSDVATRTSSSSSSSSSLSLQNKNFNFEKKSFFLNYFSFKQIWKRNSRNIKSQRKTIRQEVFKKQINLCNHSCDVFVEFRWFR